MPPVALRQAPFLALRRFLPSELQNSIVLARNRLACAQGAPRSGGVHFIVRAHALPPVSSTIEAAIANTRAILGEWPP